MESFEQLAEQYEPMIHKIIQSLHIYKNQDEFYQHGLIALWEASSRFDQEKGSFTSYAYSYIKGRCLTELRKSSKEEEKYLCPQEEFWKLIEDPSPVQSVADELLHSCGDTLTPKQQKWLVLTAQYGLSARDIAEQENVSVSAVKQWRAGARAKLMAQMNE